MPRNSFAIAIRGGDHQARAAASEAEQPGNREHAEAVGSCVGMQTRVRYPALKGRQQKRKSAGRRGPLPQRRDGAKQCQTARLGKVPIPQSTGGSDESFPSRWSGTDPRMILANGPFWERWSRAKSSSTGGARQSISPIPVITRFIRVNTFFPHGQVCMLDRTRLCTPPDRKFHRAG